MEYLEFREDRVCALCNNTFELNNGTQPEDERAGTANEYATSSTEISVEVPPATAPPSVLKRQDRPRTSEEPRSVVFFDGIRPGGDLMESEFHGNGRRLAIMNAKRQRRSPGGQDGTELCMLSYFCNVFMRLV